jgi:hypothetical protein
MLLTVALALLAASPFAQEPSVGVIRGVVQSDPTGLPVSLAVLEADDGRGPVFAMAGRDGSYLLRVRPGRQTLRVRHMEHAPQEIEVLVPAGAEVQMDVTLEHRPVRLAPVRVVRPMDPRADSAVVARSLLAIVVDHHNLDDPGLGGALHPGFGNGGAGADGETLYVRGSAANLQLVLLDGAPVYAPFHMGGLVESFEPEVVGSARLYLGGAPARYDGGLSYVMDLATRSGRGERHAVAGSLDFVSATARAEGPLGAVHYLASARTVHGASLSRLEGEPFPYRFADGLLRLDAPLPEGGLSFTAFANREGVRVDTAGSGDGFARWGNLAGSLRYRGRFEGADVELTVAGGRFDADVPLRDRQRLFMLRGKSDRLRANLDFTRTEGVVRLRYGASFDRTWLTHSALQAEEDRRLIYARASGSALGGYLDASWQPVPRLLFRGGMRADAFSVGGVAVLAPRASGTWLVADGAALTLAAGRYHQYVRVPRPLLAGAPPRNFADSVRLATQLAVGGATHFAVGLDQDLGNGVRLGLESFYKRFDGLPAPADADTLELTGHNSGVDVWVRRSAGELTGWLGYSLGWAWSTERDTGIGSRFAGRQTLSAGVAGPVWHGTTVGARVAYGAGLPHGPVSMNDRLLGPEAPEFGSTPGAVETEPPLGAAPGSFFRLDAELSRTWHPRVGGRATHVTPYFRVLNALGSRDGLLYRYFSTEQGTDGVQAVATLPVIPVVGISWTF